MQKPFAFVSSMLAIALLLATTAAPTRSAWVLALDSTSPDQSTGPYNPGSPQDDAANRNG